MFCCEEMLVLADGREGRGDEGDLRIWWRRGFLFRDGRGDGLGIAGFGFFFCDGCGDARDWINLDVWLM